MKYADILAEKERLISEFTGADDRKIAALDGLLEQAAFERVYLRHLNEKALMSGLVRFNPENPERQQSLPVSAEIARHTAALTNIMDKLMKHLGAPAEDEDDELSDYV